MSGVYKYILAPILILSVISCTDNRQKRKDIVAEKIEILNNELNEWSDLTQRILKNEYVNSHLGKFISPNDLDKSLSKELKEKGIIRLSVHKSSNCQEVEYSTNWTEYPIGSLYLTWTSCDSAQTQKGYYKDNFHINFIEVWGVGNNWLIWIDSDFI